MIFTKPIRELTFEDIEALVDGGELEGISVDYKREVDTSPSGKKELAKDVSGLAKSQGGYVIIGVAEEDHRPVMPEQFVPRMLGQHKVEEWLEQVLNSNIAQRLKVHITPIPVPDRPGECVVVIHIPKSPRVPHMVTADGEKRYYKRHNFQTLPAEEYEVRDMFERGRRMRDEVERYLRRWGYPDPADEPEFEFGINSVTRKLGLTYLDRAGTRVVEPGLTVVSFVACPSVLEELVDASDEGFRAWLRSTGRVYHPGGLFVPQDECRHMLAGLLCFSKIWLDEDDPPCPIHRYVSVHHNGYVEQGYADGAPVRDLRVIDFVHLVGRFWQFLGFVKDLYEYVSLSTTAIVALNIANVRETSLANLGYGWAFSRDSPLERHVRHLNEVDFHSLDDGGVEGIVREFAARIGTAFGQDRPRCFNFEDGSFPLDRFRPRE